MARAPRVSVCVPARDGAAFLRRCLDSALDQTVRDFELLVVDDASSDGTLAVAREYAARDPRVRVVANRRRRGLVGNWNRCVRLARGAWVKFLFQDDALHPRALELMLAAARPGDDLVVCRRRPVFAPDTPSAVRELYRAHLRVHSIPRRFPGRARVTAGEFSRVLLRWPDFNCVGEPTAYMVRRSAFERLGLFDPDLVMLCDWELAARAAASSGLVYVPRPLASFSVHEGAESARWRRSRRFRAEVVDGLLLRSALLEDPAWAPARRVARRLGPAADLRRALAAAVHAARERAGAHDAADWAWALRRRPVLARLLAGPDPRPRPSASAAARRRAALALLGAARGWSPA